jgi:hypothetical protein
LRARETAEVPVVAKTWKLVPECREEVQISTAKSGKAPTCGVGDSGDNRRDPGQARTAIVPGVCHLVESANGIHSKVILCVYNDDVQADAIGSVDESVNRIEPTDVEGVEWTAGFAGRIVLWYRHDVENAVSAVYGSPAGGTIFLRATTVQEKSEGQHGSQFDKLRESRPHRKTSSRNSTRIFRTVALLSIL